MLMRSLPFEVDDEDLLPALGLAVEEAEDDEGEALAIITYDPFDELMNDDEEHVDPETTLQWRNSWECQVVHAFEHSGHEHILRHYYNSINMDLEVPLGQFFFSMKPGIVLAAMHGNLPALEVMVELGADLEVAASNMEDTALIVAASKGHLHIIKYLVEHGANINHIDKMGRTALREAASGYFGLPMVKYLIEHGAHVNVYREILQATILIHAISRGSVDMVQYLIDHGADVHRADPKGNTPLMEACDKGYFDIVCCLVKNGARINAVNENGESALFNICRHGYLNIAQYLIHYQADINLISKKTGNNILFEACEASDIQMVQFLLMKGIDVNHRNKDGETALMKASDKACLPLVQCLVECGASIEVTDNCKLTALNYAVSDDVRMYLMNVPKRNGQYTSTRKRVREV